LQYGVILYLERSKVAAKAFVLDGAEMLVGKYQIDLLKKMPIEKLFLRKKSYLCNNY